MPRVRKQSKKKGGGPPHNLYYIISSFVINFNKISVDKYSFKFGKVLVIIVVLISNLEKYK